MVTMTPGRSRMIGVSACTARGYAERIAGMASIFL